VLVKPGWMAVYGKEAAEDVADAKEGDKGQNLVPVREGETVRTATLERRFGALRPELDQVTMKVTAGALEERASQLGVIEERSEDPETGALTLRVRL
jgi:DNA topoisomerase-3